MSRKPNFDVNLSKSVDREIWVKVSGSRCVLEGYVKDNYYARFETHTIIDVEKTKLRCKC